MGLRVQWSPDGDLSTNYIDLYNTAKRCFIHNCEITLVRESGFGMPPLKHLTDPGPFEDGEQFIHTKILPRTVSLTFKLHGTYPDLLAARMQLLQWFNPGTVASLVGISPGFAAEANDMSTLRRIVNGNERDLRCHVTSMNYDMVTEDFDEFTFDVELTAFTYPLFRAPDLITTTYAGASPLACNATNSGDWKTYPQIDIIGPITNPILTNSTTGKVLKLEMAITGSGDNARFVLRPGNKQVFRNTVPYDSYKQYVPTDCDLGTFCLVAGNEVDGGVNSITLTGTGTTGSTGVEYKHYEWFLGA